MSQNPLQTAPARQTVASGTRWEKVCGYSRAVKVGQMVFVSGTTATGPDGKIASVGDPYAQAVQIFKNIQAALEGCGARLEHVVRTRMYITNITHWEAVARAHLEFFKDIRPASTLVEVSRLVDPAMLLEVEVDAVIP